MTTFSEFLNKKFFEYEHDVVKRRASVSDYALWLGVSQPSLSQWMRGAGREPNLENLVKISSRLGGRDTFQAAGYGDLYETMLKNIFDDPRFWEVATAWFDGTLDEAERDRLLAIIRKQEDCPPAANEPEPGMNT
jgi:transcriptional regulator with XRE-family HTH domain